MHNKLFVFGIFTLLFYTSCKKIEATYDPPTEAKLIFRFKFDSTQVRLGNTGEPTTIAPGHAAQSPRMTMMSAHYIELASSDSTPLGAGEIMYRAAETAAGGDSAIDFERALFAEQDSVFLQVPIKAIRPGNYKWLRISLAYQIADVTFLLDTVISAVPIQIEDTGTLAGFIGYKTYIREFTLKDSVITVNANKKQGYWGFYTLLTYDTLSIPFATTGQAPEGATTVVNPIFNTSPIPQGSCVVTAAFTPGKLTITGTEQQDINVDVSFSINKSFEWVEVVADGKWEPAKGESVTDMGIRGMIPVIK